MTGASLLGLTILGLTLLIAGILFHAGVAIARTVARRARRAA